MTESYYRSEEEIASNLYNQLASSLSPFGEQGLSELQKDLIALLAQELFSLHQEIRGLQRQVDMLQRQIGPWVAPL